MTRYIVTAAAVVAKTDSETGEGYFYHDTVLPEAGSQRVKDDQARLAKLKLIAEVEIVEVKVATEAAFPDGDPAEAWTVDQLKAYAASRSIDVTKAKAKADYLAAVKPQA